MDGRTDGLQRLMRSLRKDHAIMLIVITAYSLTGMGGEGL